MSLRINNNTSAINSHRNLLANDARLGKTLEKLSSGLKVNRAADGPATLVISEQMRAQVAGINQAIDNSETAISMVQTTESNMSEINNLLVSIRQLAIHAANEGVNDETMLQADQLEVMNALQTIDTIASQSQFGQKKLLDGTNGAAGSTTGVGLDFISASIDTGDSRNDGFEVRISQNASKATVQGSEALSEELIQAGETLTVIEDGKTATYVTSADDTLKTAYNNLVGEIERNGLNVDVAMDESGVLAVSHQTFGSENSFQVFSTTEGVLSEVGGQIQVAQAGNDVKGTINGESAEGRGLELTGNSGSVRGLKIRFEGQAGDGGELPKEGEAVGSVYVSQNSLKFQVGGNYNQTVGMNIKNMGTKVLANNVKNMSEFRSLQDVDVTNFQGANDTLKMVDKAINDITSIRGELGAFQKNTLESNLQNLRVAAENLTSSESVLRDVDMASEMAEYTRNQIMTQSATAMLAQANQAPNNVLRLLNQ